MASTRGYVGIASALFDCSAAMDAKDGKGDTRHYSEPSNAAGIRSRSCCWSAESPSSRWSFRTPIVQRNGQAGVVRPSRENGVQSMVDKFAMTEGGVSSGILTLDR